MNPLSTSSSPPASPLRRRRVANEQLALSDGLTVPSHRIQEPVASPLPSSPPSTSSDEASDGDDEVVPLHRPYYCYCEKCIPETPRVESTFAHLIPTPSPASTLEETPSLNSRLQAFIRESLLLWGLIYLLAIVLRWSTLIAAIHLPVLAYFCYDMWDSAEMLGGLPPLLVAATTASILELAFSVFLVIPHLARLNKFYDQPTMFPASTFNRKARWSSLRQLPYSTMPHIGLFWQGWFKGSAPCDIKRDNVKEWLAWAFFNVRMADVERREEVKIELEEMVKYIETETGAQVPPGYNTEVECMRVGLDQKRVAWRGGIYYALMTAVNLSIISLFRLIGYTNVHSPTGDLILHIPSRYTRPSSTLTRPIKKPILLLHGLAVGMTPYLPWCLYTYLTTGRPIIFLHMPSVSIRLFAPHPPTPSSFNASCNPPGPDPVTMRNVVDSAVLTDPISFGLCFVDVAQNFLYKSPTNWIELAIRVLGAREPNVANYLYRHFWWFENVIWKSEWKGALASSDRVQDNDGSSSTAEPRSATNPTGRLAIFLAEYDSIVNAEAVKRYLDQEGELSVTVIPDIAHGAFVFTPTLWADIKRAVQETARNAGAKEEEIERVGGRWW
ncbi:hypothetical protein BCR44DRAFT_1430294 [Catenaria anguillulae PL171]|uniref:Alpha/Beta hydrolase protein n=1 Tax=Catenaria anguillulae PL171 TaxID=765915 RepID=A0A1Y2HS99_9FUNG|nr:hypothetical protein BCR44DRAFT_1430294 [Catenaria anguillulae PL171]